MSDQPPHTPPLAAQNDPWGELKSFTAARIALGHAGSGLPTAAHLRFQLAHARARDAVHTPLDTAALAATFAAEGWPTLCVASAAADRMTYLTRPDLGRQLSQSAIDTLSEPATAPDVALVVADGLSSTAVTANALHFMRALIPMLTAAKRSVSPLIIATQSRVALGDHIGALLQAKLTLIAIGERPGLSAADSLGVYITWKPERCRIESERNCISNIRSGGLPPDQAAAQSAALIDSMFRYRSSGVGLSARLALPVA
ncbi:MAG: ethanolamine ammonia-lyase subunit EutC [Rhizomicrobium sp.]